MKQAMDKNAKAIALSPNIVLLIARENGASRNGGASISTAGAQALEAVTEAVGLLEELVRSQPVASVELGAQLAEVVGRARLLPSGSTNKGSDGNKHRHEIVAIAKRIWYGPAALGSHTPPAPARSFGPR